MTIGTHSGQGHIRTRENSLFTKLERPILGTLFQQPSSLSFLFETVSSQADFKLDTAQR